MLSFAKVVNKNNLTTASSNLVKYRPEIDGLRAIAVIAVIANHINSDFLPGGFLGVDIFFVISGYVITSSLYARRSPSQQFFPFLIGFFQRRVKRLVPALIVYVLATSALICCFNPAPEVSLDVAQKSLLGISNLNLYRRSFDYFSTISDLNPFVHTWSLGVEEQFYLLFPFLVFFIGFCRFGEKVISKMLFVVGFLTLLSLTGFCIFYSHNHSLAYFLMPFRMWEMGFGVIAFLLIANKRRRTIHPCISKLIPIVSFFVISLIFIFSNHKDYLEPWPTVIVVLFTVLLVLTIRSNAFIYDFLSSQLIVQIGLLSYSLYLWHWAIISLSRWTIGIYWWTLPIQIIVIVAASLLSFKYIEQPFRSRQWSNSATIDILLGAIALLVSFLLVTSLQNSYSTKFFLGDKKVLNSNPVAKEQCYGIQSSVQEAFDKCSFANSGARNTLWFLGDSMTWSFTNGAFDVASKLGNNMFISSFEGTPFPSIPYTRKDQINNINRRIKAHEFFYSLESSLQDRVSPGDTIIINQRFPLYSIPANSQDFRFNDNNVPYFDSKSPGFSHNAFFKRWQPRFSAFASLMENLGVNVVLFLPSPELHDLDLQQCLSIQGTWFAPNFSTGNASSSNCSVDIQAFVGETGLYSRIYHELETISNAHPNVSLLNTMDILCPSGKCPTRINGYPLYVDSHHYSDYSSSNLISDHLIRHLLNSNK